MAKSFYKGLDSYAVYAEDTAFGTPGTPTGSDYIDKVSSFTANFANNIQRIQGLGEGRNATHAVNGIMDLTGSMEWMLTDPDFFQYLFVGIVAGSGTAADPYEVQEADEIGYDAGQVNTLTIQIGSNGGANDDVMTYDGIVFNTSTINANVGEVINCTSDWTGRTGSSSTSLLTYSGPTNRPFTFIDGGVTLNGDTLGEVTAFSITANNNMQIFRQLGQRLISQPVAGTRRYEFSVTMKLHYDDAASAISGLEARGLVFDGTTTGTTPTTGAVNTAFAMSLDLVEGASSGDRVVNFDFEDCYFESISTPIALGEEGAGLVEITLNGYALSGLTDGAAKVPVRWYTIA